MNKQYPLADDEMRATVNGYEGDSSNDTSSVGVFGALEGVLFVGFLITFPKGGRW